LHYIKKLKKKKIEGEKKIEEELKEEDMNYEQVANLNKNYIDFKYSDDIVSFLITKNGKYFVRYFENGYSYLQKGKTLSFEINVDDKFNHFEENNVPYINVLITSWDPYEKGTWIAFYEKVEDKVKGYKEYYTYLNITSFELKVSLKDYLYPGKWECRLFENKDSIKEFGSSLEFEIIKPVNPKDIPLDEAK